MDALLNLPAHNSENFSRYKQTDPAKQPIALQKQEASVMPKFSPCTSLNDSPSVQVVGNEKRNILLREFYRMGLQRDKAQHPMSLQQARLQQQQQQHFQASPKRQPQPHADEGLRAKQPRFSVE